jgi:hypothetical protein
MLAMVYKSDDKRGKGRGGVKRPFRMKRWSDLTMQIGVVKVGGWRG